MGPQPANVTFNFSQGLELKTDPKQIPTGKFLDLQNTVFNKGGLLQKRNGFGQLTVLPDTSSTFVTTFNNNLTAISDSIQAYSPSTQTWVTKGKIQPVSINTQPLIRSNTSQTQADIAISSLGQICTVYTDQNPSNLSQVVYKYVVADSTTGQNIIAPAIIPASGGGTLVGSPRVFAVHNYFVILFTNQISASYHLQFIAINILTNSVTSPADISNSYVPSTQLSFDAAVIGTNLYIAYNTTAGGQSIQAVYLNSALQVSSSLTFPGYKATCLGATADSTNVYVSFYDSVSQNGYVLAFNSALQVSLVPVQIISSAAVNNITNAVQSGVCTTYYEVSNSYSFDSAISSDYIQSVSVPLNTGIPTSPYTVIRSVGLASKAFVVNSTQYFLSSYQSQFQPTYFLINGTSSTQASPVITAKLAYQNGGGYVTAGLPNAIVSGTSVSIPYLYKDLIQSVNKGTNLPSGSQVNGIYAQTGINYATFNLSTSEFDSVEIASSLHMSGGFLWQYDGYLPVEHNFLLYPDDIEATGANTGGAMVAQKYFYQVVYEWADNQGNIHRSAPSIPIEVDMSSSNLEFTAPSAITFSADGTTNSPLVLTTTTTGLQIGQYVTDSTTPANVQAGSYITAINPSTSITLSLPVTADFTPDTLQTVDTCSVTVHIPTLRLTYKTSNPVKISIYRWSTAQQNYYQVTSILTPKLNDTTADYITFTDTLADNQILGNNLLYTTGGVVENIGAPASNIMTLWQTRLLLVDAEDQNLLWYSKQVIESTPVEMSDLFTIYVAPTIGASGSTGPITALGAMDDKLVIFKKDALYYISGTGPDNTGNNNLFSDPIFITSVVGCTNQQSIVNTPLGLMFQSDKGIWLLSRSLETKYIGAPVETQALSANVLSSVLVPGTNQIRFTLDDNITLMYDYYYDQWGTFTGLQGISSCIYQSLHTFLDSHGRVFQETPGKYLDGANPVLIAFQTGWLNLAGIQGYQRIYEFALLGSYYSPHLLDVMVGYDFNNPTQQVIIRPTNFTGVYGSDSRYGQTSPYGGPPNLEQWRIHTDRQKCQVFQINLQEVFDPSFGTVAGAGLTLSGINCSIGIKKSQRPYKGAQSAG